jgi:chaperonin cofactor prefoldin
MSEAENQAHAAALIGQLQELKAEAQAIAQKIGELDQERVEHSLVAETLTGLDGSRKCYRRVDDFFFLNVLFVPIQNPQNIVVYI